MCITVELVGTAFYFTTLPFCRCSPKSKKVIKITDEMEDLLSVPSQSRKFPPHIHTQLEKMFGEKINANYTMTPIQPEPEYEWRDGKIIKLNESNESNVVSTFLRKYF